MCRIVGWWKEWNELFFFIYIAVIVRLFRSSAMEIVVHFWPKVFSGNWFSRRSFFWAKIHKMVNMLGVRALCSIRYIRCPHRIMLVRMLARPRFSFLLWCEQWTIEICGGGVGWIRILYIFSNVPMSWWYRFDVIYVSKNCRSLQHIEAEMNKQCQTPSLLDLSEPSNTCSNMLIWSMGWRIFQTGFIFWGGSNVYMIWTHMNLNSTTYFACIKTTQRFWNPFFYRI